MPSRLARIAARLKAKVNLIPFSPVPGFRSKPRMKAASQAFLKDARGEGGPVDAAAFQGAGYPGRLRPAGALE